MADKYTWQTDENVENIQSWAECMNFHIDEVISDNNKGMFWATMCRISKDVWSITCITIYDKVNKKTYTLFNENQEKMIVGTDRANDFQRWAFRQFDRLCDKLAA